MRGGIRATLVLACGFAAVLPGRGVQAAVLDRIAAVVNNDVITLSEVQEEALPQIQKITKDYVESEQDAQLAKLYQKFLDDLIVRRLQIQEARKEQLIPSQGEVNAALEDIKKKNGFRSDEELRRELSAEGLTIEGFRRRIGEQLALGRVTLKAVRNKIIVEERELREYYEANQEKFRRTPEVKIRHILVSTPPRASLEGPVQARAKADEALAKLRGGADFAEVARAYSEGPTAQAGGELGSLRRGELAPELEEAAFSIPVGEISGIIQTNSGFNIIRVESRKVEPVEALEEVREKIREAILDEKFEAKYKEWIEGLRRKAAIQVRLRDDPDRVRKR